VCECVCERVCACLMQAGGAQLCVCVCVYVCSCVCVCVCMCLLQAGGAAIATRLLESALAEVKKRAEDAEIKCKAFDSVLSDLRAQNEMLHRSKESLEKALCLQRDSAAELKKELALHDAMTAKVIQLSDALEASQSALSQEKTLQMSLQLEVNAKESLVALTNNEVEALTKQLKCVTHALDQACIFSSELKEEKAELMHQFQVEREQLLNQLEASEAKASTLSQSLSNMDETLSQRELALEVKESEVGLLRVSVSHALNDQLVAQKTAEAKEAEAAV
jgi:chromosome segregation ATPase